MITRFFYSMIFLTLFTGIAQGSYVTVSPSGLNDQNVLNQALSQVYQSGSGTVYLTSGVYDIQGQILIGSNTVLTGSSSAILRVHPYSITNYPDGTGVIGFIGDSINNVEISNFEIDGNIENQPSGYHGTGYERLINFWCDSGNPGSNISIHDMYIHDSAGDGVQICFAKNVFFYKNKMSNLEHDAFFFRDVINSEVYSNNIAGITDDCGRLDNCQDSKVNNNLFYSYDGTNNNGAFEFGENGLQISDESNKPDATENIEIYNNKFQNIGLAGIHLETTGLAQTETVFIHHNMFLRCGFESNDACCGGISLCPWGSGVTITYNLFNSCFQESILVLSSMGSATAVIEYNNILNTKGVGQTNEGLPPNDVGYGIYNAVPDEMALTIMGNYFSGNLRSDSNVPIVNSVSSQIIGAGGNGSNILPNKPTITQNGDNEPKTFFDGLNQYFKYVFWAFVATLVILVIFIYRNYISGIKKWKK
jgi:Disaggregatase related